MSMGGILFPGDDRQDRPASGECARCGGELFWYDDGEICMECKERLKNEQSDDDKAAESRC